MNILLSLIFITYFLYGMRTAFKKDSTFHKLSIEGKFFPAMFAWLETIWLWPLLSTKGKN